MDFILVVLIFVLACMFVVFKKYQERAVKETDVPIKRQSKTILVDHKKEEYLATENERKLCFALQKALTDKYMIHSQVPLISLAKPVDYRHNSKSWAKRVDFVITDTATKVVAVIELDDSTHYQKKRVERDNYVNYALKGHHPLVRMNTEKFYMPEKIAALLESEAGIKNQFSSEKIDNIEGHAHT